MSVSLVQPMCRILLALILLAGCRPDYYGATSIVEFKDGEKHVLLGKDFRQVIAQLGEPTDIIFDKSKTMMWIYKVDEKSSNPLQILPALTTGLPVKRKILMIEFDRNMRVARSVIERSKVHIVGLIGRVNQLSREIEAKKRVKSALSQLNLINSGTR
ncbi:hypothetical protein N9T26_02420 [Alphaproteobacteria bacterium]|nr:hypothetical protein [Alphaproteobacteria bacterium]